MALTPGTRLGPYVIAAQIGVGGMGEVYRATDTKLDRDVAIKVLPESLAGDPDRIARFQREAKTLAALNHPNIAAIYGLEEADSTKALFMELVEGPTLADRIAQGAIPVDEALPIAKQIAEALEAAHEQGIIHRDLKPANIKLRPDGVVKVLDFGLAKALEPTGGDVLTSQSPTITTPAMTQAGMILGTAAYMSPEQARGKPVDKRADVWAFGCVLYEMLTGKRAFAGEDVTDTLAAVVRSEPPWDALPDAVSPTLQVYLRRCLQKDPKQRIHDIGDVALALEGAFDAGASQAAASFAAPQPAGWRRALPFALTALVVGIIVGLAVWSATGPGPPNPATVTRLTIVPLQTAPLANMDDTEIAISPDGTRIAYVADDAASGLRMLFVRNIDALEAQVVPGTEGAEGPFFSPDGAWLGFELGGGALMKVAMSGGPPLTILDEAGEKRGATWAPDDAVIFSALDGLYSVPAAGGDSAERLLADAETFRAPLVLPGGQVVVFQAGDSLENPEADYLAVMSLETGEQRTLIQRAVAPYYASSGHLVFVRGNTLMAAPFDVEQLALTGDPIALLEGIRRGPSADYALSANGTLVYVPDDGQSSPPRTLVWVDRDGREEATPLPPRAYADLRISPDGTQVAVEVSDQEHDIWIWGLSLETPTRLTFDPGVDTRPAWTPDGRRVIFASEREGGVQLFWKMADGTGAAERLVESSNLQVPHSFSPDGTRLVGSEYFPRSAGDASLIVLSMEDERTSEVLLRTESQEVRGEVSPDGNWLAYESRTSGEFAIYVQPFPDVASGLWQVPTDGGRGPLWARDGRELFYGTPDGRLMAVTVQAGTTFTTGAPEVLFEHNYFVFV